MKFKVYILLLLIFLLYGCVEKRKFSSKEWKEWVESEDSPGLRWKMHTDLLDNYNLKLSSSENIIDILGNPESKTEKEFHYLLGYTGKGINTAKIIIIFENNIVIDIKVIEG